MCDDRLQIMIYRERKMKPRMVMLDENLDIDGNNYYRFIEHVIKVLIPF